MYSACMFILGKRVEGGEGKPHPVIVRWIIHISLSTILGNCYESWGPHRGWAKFAPGCGRIKIHASVTSKFNVCLGF